MSQIPCNVVKKHQLGIQRNRYSVSVFHNECIARYLEGSMYFPLLSWDAEESDVKRLSEIQNKREPEDHKSLSWLFDSM
ncbi:hypothetical protein CRYUN_Cryun06bG0130500 [Craigia yunnanensis]